MQAIEHLGEHAWKRTCDWCGSCNSRGFVWQYVVDDDCKGPHDISGGFCNLECCNAYHG